MPPATSRFVFGDAPCGGLAPRTPCVVRAPPRSTLIGHVGHVRGDHASKSSAATGFPEPCAQKSRRCPFLLFIFESNLSAHIGHGLVGPKNSPGGGKRDNEPRATCYTFPRWQVSCCTPLSFCAYSNYSQTCRLHQEASSMIERTWAAGVKVRAARAARAITLCLSLGDDSVTARSPKASCRDAEQQGAQQHHPEQIASSAATSGLLWPSDSPGQRHQRRSSGSSKPQRGSGGHGSGARRAMPAHHVEKCFLSRLRLARQQRPRLGGVLRRDERLGHAATSQCGWCRTRTLSVSLITIFPTSRPAG